jgi:dUTP pyrophosphatase
MLYVARPIDRADEDYSYIDARVTELIAKESGWISYHPARAFTVGGGVEVDNKIAHLNQIALGKSAALIAFLPNTAMAGTFMEIALAHEHGIPVAWFGDEAWSSHWSLGLRRIMAVEDIESAIAYVMGQSYVDDRSYIASQTMMVQRLHKQAQLPTRAHHDDAGLDLYCVESTVIDPGKWVDIDCGIAVQLPPGMWCQIKPRSSTFRKRRLLVLDGTIDHGYRGGIYVGVTNLSDKPVTVETGERLAQMIPFHGTSWLVPEWATELDRHDRGDAGFGSSGV